MKIPQLTVRPNPAEANRSAEYQNQPAEDLEEVRAGDLRPRSFEEFNADLNQGNLVGSIWVKDPNSVWVENPDKEGEYIQRWHRVFQGTIFAGTNLFALQLIENSQSVSSTALFGFPLPGDPSHEVPHGSIKVNPNSLLKFDLRKQDSDSIGLAQRLHKPEPCKIDYSGFLPQQKIIEIDNEQSLQELDDFKHSIYGDFITSCLSRDEYVFDNSKFVLEALPEARKRDQWVNRLSPNIRILLQRTGEPDKEIFNLFKLGKNIENLCNFAMAQTEQSFYAIFQDVQEGVTTEPIHPAFQKGDKLKIIADYPNFND